MEQRPDIGRRDVIYDKSAVSLIILELAIKLNPSTIGKIYEFSVLTEGNGNKPTSISISVNETKLYA